ncbi:hypothetical protein ATANTOWER_006926 [Ataeniobius toweri]|uniref:Uncharacterized protein n=1 Tax=Ataeniobius toweri TaxID=208326 RepID=A0ABU7AN62_9TELE|nr:hypothetical protein [Ataeniobius toweri]
MFILEGWLLHKAFCFCSGVGEHIWHQNSFIWDTEPVTGHSHFVYTDIELFALINMEPSGRSGNCTQGRTTILFLISWVIVVRFFHDVIQDRSVFEMLPLNKSTDVP